MVNSAIGTFFTFVSFSMQKSFVVVFLSPPCCTVMPCQPEVTGLVVLMLETQTPKLLTFSHAYVVSSLCRSRWVHLFHTLVSDPSECMCAMLFVQTWIC